MLWDLTSYTRTLLSSSWPASGFHTKYGKKGWKRGLFWSSKSITYVMQLSDIQQALERFFFFFGWFLFLSFVTFSVVHVICDHVAILNFVSIFRALVKSCWWKVAVSGLQHPFKEPWSQPSPVLTLKQLVIGAVVIGSWVHQNPGQMREHTLMKAILQLSLISASPSETGF